MTPAGWDEHPPAIPTRFRPLVVIGILTTGASAGMGITWLILTLNGALR